MKQRKSVVQSILGILRPLLRVLVFPVLLAQLSRGRYGYVYLCVLTLVLYQVPGWAERRLRVRLPEGMEILILLFVFSSEILGEIRACYVRFPCWDGVLHGASGFLFAAVGYALPEILDRRGRDCGPVMRVVSALCFSMTVGVLWEFLEWGADGLFGLDMQKDTVITALHSVCLDPDGGNCAGTVGGIGDTVLLCADGTRRALGLGGYLDVGLHDTMGDLLVNLAGAVLFALLVRGGKSGAIARQFVPVVQNPEEQ